MAKWVLPEGRKPLPDEWFSERAQMQDRIKKLEDKLAEYKHVASAIDTQWAESQDEIADLKDKLAKALEALRFYAEGEWPKDYPGGVLFAAGDDTPEFKTHIDYGYKARATIAELTGGKNE